MAKKNKKVRKAIKPLLYIDTEATGRDADKDRVVQVSWILTDEYDNQLRKGDYIIKPEGYDIPAEVVAIHGITTEKATAQGKPIGEVLPMLLEVWDMAWAVIGHNVMHDYHLLNNTCKRMTGKALKRKNFYCTQQLSATYCGYKLPDGSVKSPSLKELYEFLFATPFKAHNALNDAQATRRCFRSLLHRKVARLDWNHTFTGYMVKSKTCQVSGTADKGQNTVSGTKKKRNKNRFYRMLFDGQSVLSARKLDDLMRVAEYKSNRHRGEETSVMEIYECELGKPTCRLVHTCNAPWDWTISPRFYELIDFGVRHIGRFNALGKIYEERKAHDEATGRDRSSNIRRAVPRPVQQQSPRNVFSFLV